ncbi:MAG: hypothetical protein ACFB21_16690 [Opitutales bacterium]
MDDDIMLLAQAEPEEAPQEPASEAPAEGEVRDSGDEIEQGFGNLLHELYVWEDERGPIHNEFVFDFLLGFLAAALLYTAFRVTKWSTRDRGLTVNLEDGTKQKITGQAIKDLQRIATRDLGLPRSPDLKISQPRKGKPLQVHAKARIYEYQKGPDIKDSLEHSLRREFLVKHNLDISKVTLTVTHVVDANKDGTLDTTAAAENAAMQRADEKGSSGTDKSTPSATPAPVPAAGVGAPGSVTDATSETQEAPPERTVTAEKSHAAQEAPPEAIAQLEEEMRNEGQVVSGHPPPAPGVRERSVVDSEVKDEAAADVPAYTPSDDEGVEHPDRAIATETGVEPKLPKEGSTSIGGPVSDPGAAGSMPAKAPAPAATSETAEEPPEAPDDSDRHLGPERVDDFGDIGLADDQNGR